MHCDSDDPHKVAPLDHAKGLPAGNQRLHSRMRCNSPSNICGCLEYIGYIAV